MAGRIALLPPEEARKIAAGEVIDRPSALVREFMDNAIDAESSQIEVHIEDGGSRLIEVIDNGCGMEKSDLEICCKTHATSKIRSINDLNSAETLGFRGEALAAAAVVSQMEILTSADGREAWRLQVGPGDITEAHLEQSRRTKGTSVRALDLFDTIPVRKRFLKRDWSEGNYCKSVFTDKALAFPNINFRYVQDGKIKIVLAPVTTYKERFAASILRRGEIDFLHEISAKGNGFSVNIVFSGPELSRNDRRHQYIFANGRRIQDFSLLQALEYGVQGWFPNNAHPVGAVYIDIDPALADFNIHPAKREVRFADSGAIHHTITRTMREFVNNRNLAVGKQFYEPENAEHLQTSLGFTYAQKKEEKGVNQVLDRLSFAFTDREKAEGEIFSKELSAEGETGFNQEWIQQAQARHEAVLSDNDENSSDLDSEEPTGNPAVFTSGRDSAYGLRYAGRIFELFILVERGERLFIIDQHAAHERILYDKFIKKDIVKQDLLVPISFVTEGEEDDRFLKNHIGELARLGVVLTEENGSWSIEALPVSWRLSDTATIKEILNLKNSGENLVERWATSLSCHSAIKDGEFLDEETALALAQEALNLPIPRCPHGRPLWFEICREELFRTVKRI